MPIEEPVPTPKAGGFHASGFRTKTWRWGSGSWLSVTKPQSVAREWLNARRVDFAGWKRVDRLVGSVARACKADS